MMSWKLSGYIAIGGQSDVFPTVVLGIPRSFTSGAINQGGVWQL